MGGVCGKVVFAADVLLSIDLRWGGFRKSHQFPDRGIDCGIEVYASLGFERAFFGVDIK